MPLAPHVFEILLSLVDRELHGYELVRDIRERTEGAIDLGTSTLYAALRRMLAMGLVEDAGDRPDDASGGPRRRYYRITDFGREVAVLEAERSQRVARVARLKLLRPSRAAGRSR